MLSPFYTIFACTSFASHASIYSFLWRAWPTLFALFLTLLTPFLLFLLALALYLLPISHRTLWSSLLLHLPSSSLLQDCRPSSCTPKGCFFDEAGLCRFSWWWSLAFVFEASLLPKSPSLSSLAAAGTLNLISIRSLLDCCILGRWQCAMHSICQLLFCFAKA